MLVIVVAALGIALASCTTEEPEPTMPFGAWPTTTPTATPEPPPTRTPAPTRTPLPEPENTIADAIGWLRDAGLEVVEVDEEAAVGRRPASTRVSVDAYDRVWIYAFREPVVHEHMFAVFSINATYTRENYPTVFMVDNIVFQERGVNHEALRKIYTALWDRRPTAGLIFWLPEFWSLEKEEVPNTVERWLTDPDRHEAVFSSVASTTEARIVSVRDYTGHFQVDETPHGRLPHLDSLAWLIQAEGEPVDDLGPRYAAVLVDYMTNLVAGATYSQEALPVEQVPDQPVPDRGGG